MYYKLYVHDTYCLNKSLSKYLTLIQRSWRFHQFKRTFCFFSLSSLVAFRIVIFTPTNLRVAEGSFRNKNITKVQDAKSGEYGRDVSSPVYFLDTNKPRVKSVEWASALLGCKNHDFDFYASSLSPRISTLIFPKFVCKKFDMTTLIATSPVISRFQFFRFEHEQHYYLSVVKNVGHF